jgi:hypothetical protein
MSYQFQQWWAKTGHSLWRDHKFTCGELARRAYAEGAAAAIPPGWKLVPVEAPFPCEFIVTGIRTENDKESTVYLYFSDEGGGWYQWGASKSEAKRFRTEKAALTAAKGCPGPWYNIPKESTVKAEPVENKKAAQYRAMLAAAPTPPAQGE